MQASFALALKIKIFYILIFKDKQIHKKTPLFRRSLFFIFEKCFYTQLFFKQTTPLFGNTPTIITKRFQFFAMVFSV